MANDCYFQSAEHFRLGFRHRPLDPLDRHPGCPRGLRRYQQGYLLRQGCLLDPRHCQGCLLQGYLLDPHHHHRLCLSLERSAHSENRWAPPQQASEPTIRRSWHSRRDR